jgi:hypothetical protein
MFFDFFFFKYASQSTKIIDNSIKFNDCYSVVCSDLFFSISCLDIFFNCTSTFVHKCIHTNIRAHWRNSSVVQCNMCSCKCWHSIWNFLSKVNLLTHQDSQWGESRRTGCQSTNYITSAMSFYTHTQKNFVSITSFILITQFHNFMLKGTVKHKKKLHEE